MDLQARLAFSVVLRDKARGNGRALALAAKVDDFQWGKHMCRLTLGSNAGAAPSTICFRASRSLESVHPGYRGSVDLLLPTGVSRAVPRARTGLGSRPDLSAYDNRGELYLLG
jgi:hypothetical protein